MIIQLHEWLYKGLMLGLEIQGVVYTMSTQRSVCVMATQAINFRAETSDRELIDRAAEALHQTRTDFLLEAAREKAQRVLLDQTLFNLDDRRFQRFQQLLEAPVEAADALIKLLRKRAPWER